MHAHLSLSVRAFALYLLAAASSSLAQTPLVAFDASQTGRTTYLNATPPTISTATLDRWNLSTAAPLFDLSPPVYGGLEVSAASGSIRPSLFRLNPSTASWPFAAGIYAAPNSPSSADIYNVHMALLWVRENFPGFDEGKSVSLANNASLLMEVPVWQSGNQGLAASIRFLVKDSGHYYVSEAGLTAAGTLELSNFDGSALAGKRWARVELDATAMTLPNNLDFQAMAFRNVEALGVYGRGSKAFVGIFAIGKFTATGSVVSASNMSLGVNLSSLGYNTYHPYNNVLLYARAWILSEAGSSDFQSFFADGILWEKLLDRSDLDADGYPQVVPMNLTKTAVVSGVPVTKTRSLEFKAAAIDLYKPGVYRVRFRGGNGRFKITHSSQPYNKTYTFDRGTILGAGAPIIKTTTGARITPSGQSVPETIYYFDTESVVLNPANASEDPLTQVYPKGTMSLTLLESSGPNYLRGFEILSPGSFDPNSASVTGKMFAQDFLDSLAARQPGNIESRLRFKTLRMMDWGATNDSPVTTWASRTAPSWVTMSTPSGVALEHMVQLCNTTKQNLWICIPHAADDGYVENAARVIAYGSKADGTPWTAGVDALSARVWQPLDPELKVFVEYSNETWNSAPPWKVHRDHTIALGRELVRQGIITDQTQDDTALADLGTAYRSAQIWKTFETVFAGHIRPPSLLRIMPGFLNSTTINTRRLRALDNPLLNPDGILADAITIAPYCGLTVAAETFSYIQNTLGSTIAALEGTDTASQQNRAAALDFIFSRTHAAVEAERAAVVNAKKVAEQFGIYAICYEGGIALHPKFAGTITQNSSEQKALYRLMRDANRDPRAKAMQTHFLNMLHEAGMQQVEYFNHIGRFTDFGSWGLAESLGQVRDNYGSAYKMQPLLSWMSTYPNPNQPPIATFVLPDFVVDTDGDGSETVTLDGAASADLESDIARYFWQVGNITREGKTASISLARGKHQVKLTVRDAQGLEADASAEIMVAPKGFGALLQTSFAGPQVALGTTPLSAYSFLQTGIQDAGFSARVISSGNRGIASATMGSAGLLLRVVAPNTGPMTFQEAQNADQYLALSIAHAANYQSDLRGAILIARTVVDGSTPPIIATLAVRLPDGTLLLGSAATIAQGQSGSTLRLSLPDDPRLAQLDSSYELRLYFHGNMFGTVHGGGRNITISDLQFMAALQGPPPIIGSSWTQELGNSRSGSVSTGDFRANWSSTPPILWRASVGRGTSPAVVSQGKVVTVGGFQHGTNPLANQYLPLDIYGLSPADYQAYLQDPKAWIQSRGFPRFGMYAIHPATLVNNGNAVTHAIHREDTYASCHDARTGQLLWRTKVGDESISSWETPSYTRSSPLIAQGRVYCHTFDGQLSCVDLNNGAPLWQVNMKDHFMTMYDEKSGNGASPLFMAGNIIVHYLGHPTPLPGKRETLESVIVAAFDANTGALKWMTPPNPSSGHRTNHFSLTGGTPGGQPTVVVNTSHMLVGINPVNGAERWRFDFYENFADLRNDRTMLWDAADTTSGARGSNLWRLAYSGHMALISGDYIIDRFNIAHQHRASRTFCIKIVNGQPQLVWENKDLNAWRTTYAVHGGKLYVEDHNENQWSNTGNARGSLPMVEADKAGQPLPRITGAKGEVFRRPRPMALGQFSCIDIATGTVLWSSDSMPSGGIGNVANLDAEEAANQTYSRLIAAFGEPDFFQRLKTKTGGNGVYRGENSYVMAGEHVIMHGAEGIRIGQLANQSLVQRASFARDYSRYPILSAPVLVDGLLYIRKYNEVAGSNGAGGNLIVYDLRP